MERSSEGAEAVTVRGKWTPVSRDFFSLVSVCFISKKGVIAAVQLVCITTTRESIAVSRLNLSLWVSLSVTKRAHISLLFLTHAWIKLLMFDRLLLFFLTSSYPRFPAGSEVSWFFICRITLATTRALDIVMEMLHSGFGILTSLLAWLCVDCTRLPMCSRHISAAALGSSLLRKPQGPVGRLQLPLHGPGVSVCLSVASLLSAEA